MDKEEPTFAVGEIAILRETPPRWKDGPKPGEEVEICSVRGTHFFPGNFWVRDGYRVMIRGRKAGINHKWLMRKHLPPQELSKFSFQEIISELKSETPLEKEDAVSLRTS